MSSSSGSSDHYQPHHQNQPCSWLIRAIKWIPVIFIVTIIGWSYYAYVVQLCISMVFVEVLTISILIGNSPLVSVKTVTEQVLFLFFFHIVFIMFFWSYVQTVFAPVAAVPAKVRQTLCQPQRGMIQFLLSF